MKYERVNISMPVVIQKLARQLAAERGIRGGLSELARILIEEEAANPRLQLELPTSAYMRFIKEHSNTGNVTVSNKIKSTNKGKK